MTLNAFVVFFLSATAGVLAQPQDATRDPCQPDPFVCKNGGTCISPLDFIICQCRSGFGGDRCEHTVPVKIGTCIAEQIDGEFNCTRGCDNDYDCLGTQKCCNTACERQCSSRIIIDPCSGYCLNGGTCSDPGNGPTCSCPRGFSGTKCEIRPGTCPIVKPGDVSVCGGVPCATDVQCQPGQKCCHLACGGTWCTPVGTVLDPCSGYCFNGGTCNTGPVGAVWCACPHGFSGRRCEVIDHPGVCPKPRDVSVCGGDQCTGDHQCQLGQKCCTFRCGGKYCTPAGYRAPPPLTCRTVKCTANVVCRHTVDCHQCRSRPKCIPKSNLPKDIDSKCKAGGYSEAVLIQSATNSASYSPLLCVVPADVSSNTCPSDAVCVGRVYGRGHCCMRRLES